LISGLSARAWQGDRHRRHQHVLPVPPHVHLPQIQPYRQAMPTVLPQIQPCPQAPHVHLPQIQPCPQAMPTVLPQIPHDPQAMRTVLPQIQPCPQATPIVLLRIQPVLLKNQPDPPPIPSVLLKNRSDPLPIPSVLQKNRSDHPRMPNDWLRPCGCCRPLHARLHERCH
jgi:hypothetical protein